MLLSSEADSNTFLYFSSSTISCSVEHYIWCHFVNFTTIFFGKKHFPADSFVYSKLKQKASRLLFLCALSCETFSQTQHSRSAYITFLKRLGTFFGVIADVYRYKVDGLVLLRKEAI